MKLYNKKNIKVLLFITLITCLLQGCAHIRPTKIKATSDVSPPPLQKKSLTPSIVLEKVKVTPHPKKKKMAFKASQIKKITPTTKKRQCPTYPLRIVGTSLAPMLAPNTIIKMMPLRCAPPLQTEMLITFKNNQMPNMPLIKIIKAVPGDHFAIKPWPKNPKVKFLYVNHKLVKNSAGTPYFLTKEGRAMIDLYAKSYKNIIPKDSYLVLGDSPKGTLDASRFGLIHKSAIIAVSTGQ